MRAWVAVLALFGCHRLLDLQPLHLTDDAKQDVATTGDTPADSDKLTDSGIVADVRRDGCPTNYGPLGGNTGFYRVYTAQFVSWLAAEQSCGADTTGGAPYTHLVVFDDDLERSRVAAGVFSMGDFWIGLTDRVVEDSFIWITNQNTQGYPPATGSPWAMANPNPTDDTEDCVLMFGTGAEIADDLCTLQHYYICECDAFAPQVTHF